MNKTVYASLNELTATKLAFPLTEADLSKMTVCRLPNGAAATVHVKK